MLPARGALAFHPAGTGVMLRIADLDYELPESAIAAEPASPRDSARLMVFDRAAGRAEHLRVRDLPERLRPGDLLVRNTTRVLPARFRGFRADTGGRAEGLYLHDEESPADDPAPRCRVLLKMRRHAAGARVALLDRSDEDSGFALELLHRVEGDAADADSGAWVVRVAASRPGTERDWLSRVGITPLPPYILNARRRAAVEVADERDRADYQTVFAAEPAEAQARPEHGSVAAPTAGLHFTPELLERIESAGIGLADVVLHVGLGTFKPVETEFVEQHPMHAEWCTVPRRTADAIDAARAARGRIVCIGTTAARTLESFASTDDMRATGSRVTRLLITPGYRFRHADALMTNFHLPRSTLMAMVAALLPGGAAQLRDLYAQALAHGYRFYSYGDAMLIV